MNNSIAIGADIGGSHISCAAIDIENKSILKESVSENKVNNKGSKEEIIDSWANAIRSCIGKISEGQLKGIGFAMPGPFDYANGIAKFEGLNSKYENLFNVDVVKELKEQLNLSEATSIRFMNDASAFAVGEAWMGKSATYKKSLAITLGTGFGSAFTDNGIPVVQGENVPEFGCVWHLKYKDDIADGYISTRWFINTYKSKTGKIISGVKELAEIASTDTLAKSMFIEYGDNLANILHLWIKKFGVEVIVIGGNICGAYNQFGPHFESRLSEKGLHPVVEISQLKEEAAIIGSARLIEEGFWEKIKPLLKLM